MTGAEEDPPQREGDLHVGMTAIYANCQMDVSLCEGFQIARRGHCRGIGQTGRSSLILHNKVLKGHSICLKIDLAKGVALPKAFLSRSILV
ncbi:hypothetical protein [Mesorhizobium denitrificans]|uniref:hypothetical protein n=1 Tax=Mesorhizobium denitrificans TaxID=2294114 RepID=UPI0010C0A559|nr:hypothetical protein [Mesorhizobium denitrificans]